MHTFYVEIDRSKFVLRNLAATQYFLHPVTDSNKNSAKIPCMHFIHLNSVPSFRSYSVHNNLSKILEAWCVNHVTIFPNL
jgi:hypothetical protein